MSSSEMGRVVLPPLSREQVRQVDLVAIRDYGLPGVVLMENAGRGAAEWLRSRLVSAPETAATSPQRPVVICCGKGNNGGDGAVIARFLDLWGVPVQVWLFCEPAELTGDAAIHFRVIEAAGLPIERIGPQIPVDELATRLQTARWIVDGLLGTGLQGTVREPYATAILAINRAKSEQTRVLAIDIPSGLDANTGVPLGVAVEADLTATFVAPKLGFSQPGAERYTGEVGVFEIGVPRQLLKRITPSG